MNTPAQDLIFLANRLSAANSGPLTFQIESDRTVLVCSNSDLQASALAYVCELPGHQEWDLPITLDDGSVWHRVCVVLHGVRFCAYRCVPSETSQEVA